MFQSIKLSEMDENLSINAIVSDSDIVSIEAYLMVHICCFPLRLLFCLVVAASGSIIMSGKERVANPAWCTFGEMYDNLFGHKH